MLGAGAQDCSGLPLAQETTTDTAWFVLAREQPLQEGEDLNAQSWGCWVLESKFLHTLFGADGFFNDLDMWVVVEIIAKTAS